MDKSDNPEDIAVIETTAEVSPEIIPQDTTEEVPESIDFSKLKEQQSKSDDYIESETRLIKNIIDSISKDKNPEKQNETELTIDSPEEILSSYIPKLLEKDLSTEDISTLITNSGVDRTQIIAWLDKFRNSSNDNISEIDKINQDKAKAERQLLIEKRKNIFSKIFRSDERKTLSQEIKNLNSSGQDKKLELSEKQNRIDKVEGMLANLDTLRLELVTESINKLLSTVSESCLGLKEEILSPENIRSLNEELIKKVVTPELDKLISNGNIKEEGTIGYTEALLDYLGDLNASYSIEGESDEDRKARNSRSSKVHSYNATITETGRPLLEMLNRCSPDDNYKKSLNIMINSMITEKFNNIADQFKSNDEINKIIKNIIDKYIYDSGYQPRDEVAPNYGLNINKIPIESLCKDNLLRWQILKESILSADLIPKEAFDNAENLIINRLTNEALLPGGHESENGTQAAVRMFELGNLNAIKSIFSYIEIIGSGHTSTSALNTMRALISNGSIEELDNIKKSLPADKQAIFDVIVNEDSYMNKYIRDGSSNPYNDCILIREGKKTVVKEKLAGILGEDSSLDHNKIHSFYYGFDESIEIIESFMKSKDKVQEIIINSKLNFWKDGASGILLSEFENPKNGNPSEFPKRILQEGLNILDEKYLSVIDQIFESRTFKDSNFERRAFLDGLLLLNSKEDGKVVLETILNAYKGSKEDPRRMRRIFKSLAVLDSFDEYSFESPKSEDIDVIKKDLSILETDLQSAPDKDSRRIIKNRIDSLNVKLQNITGLKGIEDVLITKVIETACRELNLPEKYQAKIAEKIDVLLSNGVLEIVPALAGNYEQKGYDKVKDLLTVITSHIVEGDFKTWRYSHEMSDTQLAGLSDEQKIFWINNDEPVSQEIEMSADETEKRNDELKTAQSIINNAKQHILEFNPNFDFSKRRHDELNYQIKELTDMIKASTNDEEKKSYIKQKKSLQTEALLIGGIIEFENANPESYDKSNIIARGQEIYNQINELEIPLAGTDIEQLKKIFTVGDIKKVTAYETDDPMVLLRVGTEPQETCQSWRGGGYNECLLSYVADSNKKVLNVTDSNGNIIARSIIKLTKQKDNSDLELASETKTLLVEKPYTLLSNPELYKVMFRLLLKKAEGLSATITLGSGFNEDEQKILEEEAAVFGYEIKNGTYDVYIPESLNQAEYSDMLGGKIENFNRYSTVEAIKISKKPLAQA